MQRNLLITVVGSSDFPEGANSRTGRAPTYYFSQIFTKNCMGRAGGVAGASLDPPHALQPECSL